MPDRVESHSGKTYRFLNASAEPFYLMVSVLSGSIGVYVDASDKVGVKNNKEYFSIGYNLHNHIFAKIDPNDYNQP